MHDYNTLALWFLERNFFVTHFFFHFLSYPFVTFHISKIREPQILYCVDYSFVLVVSSGVFFFQFCTYVQSVIHFKWKLIISVIFQLEFHFFCTSFVHISFVAVRLCNAFIWSLRIKVKFINSRQSHSSWLTKMRSTALERLRENIPAAAADFDDSDAPNAAATTIEGKLWWLVLWISKNDWFMIWANFFL